MRPDRMARARRRYNQRRAGGAPKGSANFKEASKSSLEPFNNTNISYKFFFLISI